MKEEISKILIQALKKEKINISESEIVKLIEIPPSSEMGDFAVPCFSLASKMKMNPHEIALKLRENILASKEFEDIQVEGPYINFFVDKKSVALNLIKEVLNEKENYGKNNLGKQNKTMIEFSQPNTHKAFHVGHIRGTSLGESLARIFEFCGENVIRANYSGDTGMHIAKWIWCYKKYHSKEKLKDDESWIASIYVDAVKRLGKNKKFQKEADEINRKLDSKESKELNKLWEKTRKLSIKSWDKIYRELNTHFDMHFFESEVEQRGKEISKELMEKGIAQINDGAVIIKFDDINLGVWVLLRKDGTVLYSAKDLALAEKKFRDFNINKSIYVIGSEQNLHFQQLFKTLQLIGFNAKIIQHVSFDLVRLPTGKMSSRTGENIIYSDFMKDMLIYAKKRIRERTGKIKKEELEKKALALSISAMKYFMLKQNPGKTIIFNKEEALNFEGDTGPYIQYSYARANSILKKSKSKKELTISEFNPKEIELLNKLSHFKEAVIKSYLNLSPSIIAHYSYQLAQIFNEFYHECPVIGSENEAFRLKLVEISKQILKNSLNLLGIEVLEEM